MDRATFERVPADTYNQMLLDGIHAYNRRDYAHAFAPLIRAGCAGDKTSQAMIGQMYLQGRGVSRDDFIGYAWIKTAAEFHFPDFTSLARKLEEAIGPERRPRASAGANALHRYYGLVATMMSCRGESRHGAYLIDSVVCTPQSDGGGMVLLRRCVDDAAKH